jgi:hypothetical protein
VAKERPATPKQIAFLTYKGIREAQTMTFAAASDAIGRLIEGDRKDEEYEEDDTGAPRPSWLTDRLILYPNLYTSEFRDFLNNELAKTLHTYVRSNVTGQRAAHKGENS